MDISEIITLIDKYISEDDVICEIKNLNAKIVIRNLYINKILII